MELSVQEMAILAHVVPDPDAWVANALATVGEAAVMAKIDRWRPVYVSEKSKPDYKNRVQRDAEEAEKMKPTPEQIATNAAEKLIREKMREQAIAELIKESKLTADGKIVK
jgi:hypothetical protein